MLFSSYASNKIEHKYCYYLFCSTYKTLKYTCQLIIIPINITFQPTSKTSQSINLLGILIF